MPKSVAALLEDVEAAQRNQRNRTSIFLRAAGWTYTCETPGCHWLWQKTLPDGRTLLTYEDMALGFEQHLMSHDEPTASQTDGGAS